MSNVGKMSQVLNAYPVGSIYMSVNSTNPGELFGGTWEQIQGRFLLGQGSGYSAGATGGEANHTLSTSEIPAHNHYQRKPVAGYSGWGNDTLKVSEWGYVFNWNGTTFTNTGYTDYSSHTTVGGNGYTNNTGGGSAHNNMPPYLVVYIWKRTA